MLPASNVRKNLRPHARSLRLILPLLIVFGCITCVHAAQDVTLNWNASPGEGVVNYRLRYGAASGAYTRFLDTGPRLSFTVPALAAGTYYFVVTAINAVGEESLPSHEISVVVGGLNPSRKSLLNVSVRTNVQSGSQVLIGGFIVTGTAPKTVALRALGPSLASSGLGGAMTDPRLALYNSTGALIASNDNWTTAASILPVLRPSDLREAVIVATLPPGSYSAVLQSTSGVGGIAVFELFDLDPASACVANLSSRGHIGTGDSVMIGGFIVGGDQATKVIVRALGPSLSAAGIIGALHDPLLELHDANGALIFQNDNWRTDQPSQISETGVAPGDDREAAIVATLAPGNYTAIVRGAANATGIGLVEIYNLDH